MFSHFCSALNSKKFVRRNKNAMELQKRGQPVNRWLAQRTIVNIVKTKSLLPLYVARATKKDY